LKTILTTLIVLALIAGAAAFGGWSWYQRFLAEPVDLATEQDILIVPPGATVRSVSHDLADRRWISSRFLFTMLAYQRGQQEAIKAGEYAIDTTMRPADLLDLITSGKSIQFPVTLVPGTTFRDALKTISDAGVFKIELANLTDEVVMERIGMEQAHPEGWLFPDTYLFGRNTSDIVILKRAYNRMHKVLTEEWASRAEDLPYKDAYEALIMASIVEKETGLASERPTIAGVFVRRLRQGMRLQTDPTVIYGMGDAYDGNIRRADLQRKTPYNTYVIDGLPPTPIALPGREAINAALHPAPGETLYFVSRGDGSHHFSVTLHEHNCAVRHYQLKQPCASLVEQPSVQPVAQQGAEQ
jgi:UPF0755 protein